MNYLCCLLMLCCPLAMADRYRIDPTHTYAHFSVDHLGFSLQRGRFDQSSGTLELDLEAKKGVVNIKIEVASLSSGDAARDRRLKGSSFFDAEKYPLIEFTGSNFDWPDERPLSLSGDLTVHGVTRPVTLAINRFKCGFHLFNLARACGADATVTIKRSDYEMGSWLTAIGNEVDITLQIEAIRE